MFKHHNGILRRSVYDNGRAPKHLHAHANRAAFHYSRHDYSF